MNANIFSNIIRLCVFYFRINNYTTLGLHLCQVSVYSDRFLFLQDITGERNIQCGYLRTQTTLVLIGYDSINLNGNRYTHINTVLYVYVKGR